MTHSGMEVKHRKCAVLHGQRTGNNWSRKDSTASTQLVVQDTSIPIYGREQSYTYLGHQINLSATSEEEQLNKIISEFKDTMAKIDVAPLAVAAKLQAINVMATSKLHFYFPNIIFTDKVLDTIEDTIVSHVRSWLSLNKSSTRSFMFSPRSEGGLGLFHPRSMYYAKKLSFMLSVLNSDDEQTRHTAMRYDNDEEIQLSFTDPKAFFTSFKRNRLQGRLTDWRQLECPTVGRPSAIVRMLGG